MLQKLYEEWTREVGKLARTPFFHALDQGRLELDHYKVWLRETYYNTRENPQSFALMAGHLTGRHREITPRILRHAAAEFGHHDLALADLQTLGEDVKDIPGRRPLPTTEALIAFAIYNVQHGNPLAYLGYVYHLEMMPALQGNKIIGKLEAMGVPKEAMTFLAEHAHADVGHTKLLEGYFKSVVETEEDLQAVLHGALGTCRLHGVMLQGILEAAETNRDWAPGNQGLRGGEKPASPAAQPARKGRAQVP